MFVPWLARKSKSPRSSRPMLTAMARWRFRAYCSPRARAGWRSVRWRKAWRLRRGGIDAPRILIMGGFLPYEGEAVVEHKLTPCSIRSTRSARCMSWLAGWARKLSYHLKIDSGMGRLGTRAGAAAILETLRANAARPPGRSDDALRVSRRLHHPQTADQLAYFHAVCDRLREARRCGRAGCTPPAPTPSVTGGPRAGTTWCAPAMRFTDTSHPRAARRRRSC